MRVTLFSMPLVYANRDKGSKSLLKDRRTTDFCINHQLPRAVQISLRLSLERANKPIYPAQIGILKWICVCGVLDSFLIFSEYWGARVVNERILNPNTCSAEGTKIYRSPFFSLVINCYNFENAKEVWCKIWEALLTSFPQVLNLSRCLSHYANFDIQQTNGRVAMNERIRSFAFDR